jgi:hypothetical protein
MHLIIAGFDAAGAFTAGPGAGHAFTQGKSADGREWKYDFGPTYIKIR